MAEEEVACFDAFNRNEQHDLDGSREHVIYKLDFLENAPGRWRVGGEAWKLSHNAIAFGVFPS